MTSYVQIPQRPGFPVAELSVRISSPENLQSTKIDAAYPTIIFLPTLWTDSFFFYPQFDDPTFFEHFNLIAIDLRGYGMSRVGEMQDRYDWKAGADDVREVMAALHIQSAHFIAITFASLAALHFASTYPSMMDSMSLITPPQKDEPFLWALAFDECAAAMRRALEENDVDSLDAISIAAWEFSSGSFQSPALTDLREETLQLARCRLANGEIAAPYLESLLASRLPSFDRTLGNEIRCPVLILFGTEDGCQSPDERDTLIQDINKNSHRKARASLQVLEGLPRWMTLTSSNIVNPILTSFLTSPFTQPLPLTPETPTFSRSISRRPSTPRVPSGFDIPSLPTSPLRSSRFQGYSPLSAQPVSPLAPTTKSHDDDGAEGVRMTVEVTVVTDT